MKSRTFFCFAGSTVNRLDAMANNIRRWVTKEVSYEDDKGQSDIKMLQFRLFYEVRTQGMVQVGQLKVIII